MAGKLKKTSWSAQPQGFGTRNLAKTAPLSQLRRANSLVVEKQFSAAKTFLDSLNQTYPHDREVLVMMVNVCLDMDDMIGYGKACAQLMQVDPNDADAAYGLAGAYIANGHPLLAMQALRTAVEKFPNYEKAAQTHQTIAELQPRADEMLAGMNLEGEDGLKSALLHEQGQVYMAQGDLDLAEQAEKAALQLRPELISAQNNLSLISWRQGNFDQSIAIAQQVLDQEPDNIHALSNLIHFYYLKGEFELAVPLSDRLKTSQGKAWDGWTKKAEGLSFLRDDAGVLDIFAEAQAAGEVDDASTSPMFLHLVAVALARLGRVKEATQQWQKLLKKFPSYPLAIENLHDISKPIGQQHGAWPFPMTSWLNPQFVPELLQEMETVNNAPNNDQMTQVTDRYLAKRPEIVKLLPILLERGDPPGRQLMIHLATVSKLPAVQEALKEFALGQCGPDEMRYKAATKLIEVGVLSDKKVRLWLKGAWQEVMLLAYEFHNEPSVVHSRPVEALLRSAIKCLKKDTKLDAEQAEALLQEALQAEPDAPDLWNNLAVAYTIQGREADAEALIAEIATKYPDYLLIQVALARFHLAKDDLEAADALLKPMLSRQRFSFTEFGEFSDTYLFLLVAQEHLEAAKVWLKMWEGMDPEHPKLGQWQIRLGTANLNNAFGRLASKFKPRK